MNDKELEELDDLYRNEYLESMREIELEQLNKNANETTNRTN